MSLQVSGWQDARTAPPVATSNVTVEPLSQFEMNFSGKTPWSKILCTTGNICRIFVTVACWSGVGALVVGLSHAGADPIDDPSGFSRFMGGIIAGSILFILFYVIYCLLHRAFSSTKRYLDEIQDVAGGATYVEDMKQAEPHLILAVECYHYQTRTRTVTENDPNGGTRTRTETYQEKVTSFSTKEGFPVNSFQDKTYVNPQMHKSPIVRLQCSVVLLSQDQETHDAIKDRLRELHAQYQHVDTSISVTWHVRLAGFKSHLLLAEDPENLPRCYNPGCYSATLPLGCGTCFHFYFLRHSVEVPLRIIKSISVRRGAGNRPPPSAPPPSAPTEESWKDEVGAPGEPTMPQGATAPIVKDWAL